MIRNYLTVDVEDYYQVSAFEGVVRFEDWGDYPSRVVANTRRILDIFYESGDIKATFFVLGWVAERNPQLVKEIAAAGHEVACHSYQHKRLYTMTPVEVREDTLRAKKIIEDIIGAKVRGYRAPSYSITAKSLWVLDILEELGFEYDSSIFPIIHDRYGIPDAQRFSYRIPGKDLVEYPISTTLVMGKNVPVAGGGYFRFLPLWFIKNAFKKINEKEEQPFIFYIHPWEVDPDQPRIEKAGVISNFRHYVNLAKTEQKLRLLLKEFPFGKIYEEE